ncbi:unnamed protein product [Durusdinium trenchii]|uniref:Uncharacterized protein n=1 Tax=Durusdinium trenchii TaxID=1381693 RepID=A0ABP0Q2J2_9DINO
MANTVAMMSVRCQSARPKRRSEVEEISLPSFWLERPVEGLVVYLRQSGSSASSTEVNILRSDGYDQWHPDAEQPLAAGRVGQLRGPAAICVDAVLETNLGGETMKEVEPQWCVRATKVPAWSHRDLQQKRVAKRTFCGRSATCETPLRRPKQLRFKSDRKF